jgi:putative transposase
MSNHVHFVVVPESERSLSRVFGRAHADLARYANVARRDCGHFWQARFYSCAMYEWHAWRAQASVERSPVRAGLIATAEECAWSTASAHSREDAMEGRLDLKEWRRWYSGERWSEELRLVVAGEAAGGADT